MQIVQSRRSFLTGAGAVAAGLAAGGRHALAEPPPEVTTLRLPMTFRALCEAPKNIATELLRAEGFADVQFVEPPATADYFNLLDAGTIDFNTDFPPPHIQAIDAGKPVTVLAGLHSGCLELIASDDIQSIADLKGRKVGVFVLTSAPHVLVSLMAAYIGLDPTKDIEWVESPDATAMQLFNDGKVDAFLAAPPEPQEQRALGRGHAIVNTTVDRPWSQYFCCMLSTSPAFLAKNPVATKRAMRAMLKAADICATQPELAARMSVEGKFTDNYDYALQGLSESRYDRWREFDPEDTMRYYALRMNEVGFIKSGPNSIVADGTDWRFLTELKQEMKT